MPNSPLALAAVFMFGLLFGSFFNVAIHRWPLEDRKLREWVSTPSRCPKCMSRIRWYDNIPLLSWIMLGGRCRNCREPISVQYPAIELSTAILWVITVWLTRTHGLSNVEAHWVSAWHVLFAVCFVSLAFLTIVIDFQTSLIPDEICIPNLLLGWLALFACAPHAVSSGWADSLWGMMVLALPFLVFSLLGWMGGGDVFYVAGVGAFLGWKLTLASGMLAIAFGGTVAVVIMLCLVAMRKYKRGIPIPFGPYLALGSITALFFGDDILQWYLGLLHVPT